MEQKNTTQEKSYWDSFYSKMEFEIPSQFCALLASEITTDVPILEFGCGNGRDSLFLARHGYNVCAVDLSINAIEKCKTQSKDVENITFKQGDISTEDDVCSSIVDIKKKFPNKATVVYSRFFFHSIDEVQEKTFLSYLSKYLNNGDLLYLEFRSKEDETIDKIYGDHYRRYINTENFIKNLTEDHGFQLNYTLTGQGMAKYKSEDPFVSRIIATKV